MLCLRTIAGLTTTVYIARFPDLLLWLTYSEDMIGRLDSESRVSDFTRETLHKLGGHFSRVKNSSSVDEEERW